MNFLRKYYFDNFNSFYWKEKISEILERTREIWDLGKILVFDAERPEISWIKFLTVQGGKIMIFKSLFFRKQFLDFFSPKILKPEKNS